MKLTFTQELLLALAANEHPRIGIADAYRTDRTMKLERVLDRGEHSPDVFWLGHLLCRLEEDYSDSIDDREHDPSNFDEDKHHTLANQHNAVLNLIKSRISPDDSERLDLFWDEI